MNKTKVYVALSGGVDSSVSAALLQQQGYDVHGVFIEVWQPDFLPCSQDNDRKSALRVAAHLGIPFYTLDARDAYKRDVVDAMVAQYAAGRTPNPDVWCNRYVKFGALADWIQQQGGGHIATGHYAQIQTIGHPMSNSQQFHLLRGVDSAKDQSYFLWQLTQADLAHTMFPIGHLPKPQVRKLAQKFNLPTATKKDSQGLCFMGAIDIKEFLSHFIVQTPGAVLDEHGARVGEHDGALFYTLGQRHGFTLHTHNTNRTEMYVVAKNIEHNTITVGSETKLDIGCLILKNVNEIVPIINGSYDAQIRYHGTVHKVTVQKQDHGTLTIEGLAEQPAAGQSVVLYKGSECVGGGIVA